MNCCDGQKIFWTHSLDCALTIRQTEILEFMQANVRLAPPTFATIKKAFGFKSNQAVLDHLKALQKKGYLDKNYLPNKEMYANRR